MTNKRELDQRKEWQKYCALRVDMDRSIEYNNMEYVCEGWMA